MAKGDSVYLAVRNGGPFDLEVEAFGSEKAALEFTKGKNVPMDSASKLWAVREVKLS